MFFFGFVVDLFFFSFFPFGNDLFPKQSHPDMTFAADWALFKSQLSIYPVSFYGETPAVRRQVTLPASVYPWRV